MSIDLLPEFIRENYEVHEWKHACAILHHDFPTEWDDILAVLSDFRLNRSWITNPGGLSPKFPNLLTVIYMVVTGLKKNSRRMLLSTNTQWLRLPIR